MLRHLRDELHEHNLYVNQIPELFLWHFDDDKEAAEFFGVTVQTVKRWKKTRRYPMSVVRLLLIVHRGFLPNSRQWREFKVKGEYLITPGGRAVSVYDLHELDIRYKMNEPFGGNVFTRHRQPRT